MNFRQLSKFFKVFKELVIEIIRAEGTTTQGKINIISVIFLGLAINLLAFRGVVEHGILYLFLFLALSGFQADILYRKGVV